MPARKWILEYEVVLKLHSGSYRDKIILKADTTDEGIKRAVTAAIAVAKRMDGIIIGLSLINSETAWQAVPPWTPTRN